MATSHPTHPLVFGLLTEIRNDLFRALHRDHIRPGRAPGPLHAPLISPKSPKTPVKSLIGVFLCRKYLHERTHTRTQRD